MTTLPRAATSPELALLRSDNQSSRLYLSIYSPATIYSALLNGIPTGTDKIAQITYDTGSGTYTNIKADMMILIGSSAGGAEYGIARVRNLTGLGATSGTINIAETSAILWVDNAYLTIVDDFDLCPRHINIASDGTTPLMDYDVAYTNQNTTAGAQPTPVMGPHAVLMLRGTTVTYQPDASSSWVKDGTIASYAWTATGASATSGMTTATPTITYNAAGNYRLELTVTGSNGVAFTGYRRVFVVTETLGVTTQFEISQSPTGDYSAGGWSFGVTLYDEATLALVRDRALVILHSVDYYGNTQQSLGYVAGCENIIAIGRIAAESIVWGTEDKWGTVTFMVQGPQWWLGHMTAFPTGVKDTTTTPNKWTKFLGLTLNKAWYHFMAWRTTATRCMDVYPISDTRRHKRLEAPGGENIWAQLIEIGKRSMLADPICDRYGRLFLQIEQQLVSDRSSFPVIQALTTGDWYDEIRIERVTVKPVGLVDMSGISWDGTTATPIFSLAPGHVFDENGSVEVVDRLMLVDQATTNTQAGLYSAWKNNEFPRIEVKLASNHRLFDIAPYQRFTLAITATDTPRGITESLTIIPRAITYEYNTQGGYSLTTATFEAEVTAALAVTGDTPPTPPDTPIQPVDPPVDPPPIDPVLPSDASALWFNDATHIWYSSDFNFHGTSQPTYAEVAALPTGLSEIRNFAAALDGSAIYIIATVSGVRGFWKCANPKAVSPTWTKLLESGDTINGHTVCTSAYLDSVFNCLVPHGNKMTTAINWTGGAAGDGTLVIYNGSSLTGYDFGFGSGHDSGRGATIGHDSYVTGLGVLKTLPAYVTIGNYFGPTGEATCVWQNMIGGDQWGIERIADAAQHFRNITDNIDFNQGVNVGFGSSGKVVYPRGAYYGTEIDFVASDGTLYVASDGVTFATKATWQIGCVEQAKTTGGGPLVWLARDVVANNEFIRVSNDGGLTWVAMTGNFWSIASGNKTFINLQLVFA